MKDAIEPQCWNGTRTQQDVRSASLMSSLKDRIKAHGWIVSAAPQRTTGETRGDRLAERACGLVGSL